MNIRATETYLNIIITIILVKLTFLCYIPKFEAVTLFMHRTIS